MCGCFPAPPPTPKLVTRALGDFTLETIPTGTAEYTSTANGGLLKGRILVAGFIDGNLRYVTLSPDGRRVAAQGVLASGFSRPVGLAVGPDGAIYICEAGDSLQFSGSGPARITVLEPAQS
jgi:glucose/arabinose dehydrogenase